MIDPADVESVKNCTSIRGLFERDGHVLKRVRGETYKCCCPFHQERTPSCHVHDDAGFFRCFGCEAKGGVFEYWALSRGMDKRAQFVEIFHQLESLLAGGAAASARRAEP